MPDDKKEFPDKGKANAWKWIRRIGTVAVAVVAVLILRRKPPGI
jgi:hypothetical protein